MSAIIEKFLLNIKPREIIDVTSKICNLVNSLDIDNAFLNIDSNSQECAIATIDYNVFQNEDIYSIINSILEPKIDINKEYNPQIAAYIKAEIMGRNKNYTIISGRLQIPEKQKIILTNFSHNMIQTDAIITIVN